MDRSSELTRTAVSATLHCLTGCAFGEILGLVIATALGWGNVASMALAIALAFVFGYSFTLIPGAMTAGLGDPLFWGSLAGALFLAFWAALPVNRWLIARGKGHAVMHAHHAH